MLTEDLTLEPTTRAHLTLDRKLEVPPTTVDQTLDPTTTADRTLDPTTTAQLTPVRKTADTTQALEVGADQLTLDLTTPPTLDLTTQDRTLDPAGTRDRALVPTRKLEDQTLDPVGTQDRTLDRTLVPTTHPTLVLTTPDLPTLVPTHPTLDLRTAAPTTADRTPVPTTQPTLPTTPALITPDQLERALERTLDRQPVMEANLDPTTVDRTLARMPESNRAPDPTTPDPTLETTDRTVEVLITLDRRTPRPTLPQDMVDLHPTTRVPERLDPVLLGLTTTNPTRDRAILVLTQDRTLDRVPESRARPLVRLVNQEKNSR